MNKLRRLSLMLFVLISCVGCDQLTKGIVRARVPESSVWSFLGDLFRLQHVENHGAFLGLGATMSESTRFFIFTALVGLALLGMLVYVILKPNITAFNIVAVSLILGGGVGNLIDRILFRGGVTDFLNFGIGQVRTGIFNLADVAIMIGFAMFVYRSYRADHRTLGSQ